MFMQARIAKAAGFGTTIALGLVVVTYLVADAASGPLLVTQPGSDDITEIALGAVVAFTVLGGAVGLGLALVVHRRSWPPSTFIAVCAAALALYGIVPFTAAEQTSTAIWLDAMHVAAAAPIISLLARSLADERKQPTLPITEPQTTEPERTTA
jgi:peptidoglycan/LPS O-acetylase OafA/YrhL